MSQFQLSVTDTAPLASDPQREQRSGLTVVVAMLCLVLSASFAVAQEKPLSVSLTETVGGWMVHEPTGRVFASVAESNEIVEFDCNAKEVRRIKIADTPASMIIKRDNLIIACKKNPSLHIFDLQTNQVTGVIPIAGSGPTALFCSQVDNPYVYCISNTGSAWWDGEVFQADIRKFQVRKRMKVQPWGQSHVMNVAMSRDGKWIVPDARGASSPSGADLMKVDEEEATFIQIRDYHDSFGPIVAGPMNRYWTFGNALYSLDIAKRIRSFAGSPVAIHPQFDLVASRVQNGIALERLSDASAIDQINLDRSAATPTVNSTDGRPTRPAARISVHSTVQFDLKNNKVFCGSESTGVWIELEGIKDKLAPLKVVQAPSEVRSMVHQPLRIPLPITNPNIGAKVTLKIQSGPEAAKIDDGHFVWTPRDEDVGITTVRFDVVSSEGDKIWDTAETTVHVTLPKIDLQFQPKMMELSEDRRFAVLWGPAPGQESRHPAHSGPDSIAVVDLKTFDTIATKELPQGIRCATIDKNYVFIAPNSGNLFYRLNHQLEGNLRQFIQFAPQTLIKIGPDLLAAVAGQMAVFDTNTLKPATQDYSKIFHQRGNQAIAVVGKNALQIGPRIFQPDTGETLRLSPPISLPLLQEGQVAGNAFNNQPSSIQRWGRRIQGNTIVNHAGSQITNWSGQRIAMLSDRWPVVFTIATTSEGKFVTTTLEIIDIVEGNQRQTFVIDVSPPTRTPRNLFGGSIRIAESNDHLLVLTGSSLLVANIPESFVKSMPQPSCFSLRQTVEIDLMDSIELNLNVDGPRENLTFSQLIESPGIDLDSKTGKLTLNLRDRWNETIKTLAAKDGNAPARQNSLPPSSSLSENAVMYKDLTGKQLAEDKLAATFPVSVVLRDSQGQEDSLRISVIVLGPRKDLDDAIKTAKNDRDRQLALMAQERQKRQEAAMKAANDLQQSEGQTNASLPQRVDALEARVRRLEAALDTALKKLEQK